ncbi:MAG: leucyl aminopeptidase, partial [Pseudomonadota bacterium]
MTELPVLEAAAEDIDAIADATGTVAVFVGEDGKLGRAARRVERLTRGALGRAVASEAFGKLEDGGTMALAWPTGLTAERLVVVRLGKKS